MKRIELDASVINKKNKRPKPEPPQRQVDKSWEVSSTPSEIAPHKKDSIFKRLKTGISTLLQKYRDLPPFKKAVVTILLCVLIAGGGGLGIYYGIIMRGVGNTIEVPSRITATKVTTSFSSLIKVPETGPPRDKENPINGELYTTKEYKDMLNRYPIAVMVENHIDARMQSGYNRADLVFETLAEGGITRTMAIFWGKDVEQIGPVRSARQYFIEWLMPFDPLYMHIGYASTDDPRTNAGGSIYEYGIKSMDRAGTFWRITEKFAPHNAYTSTELLYEMAEAFGYTGKPSEIEAWKFKRDAPEEERGSGPDVTLTFFKSLYNGGIYDITWKYDSSRNVYLRYNFDTPYTDELTGENVFAKNVVVQRVEMISAYDSGAHLIITTIGEGDAIILQDGHVIEGKWKKKDINSRTRYFDSEGNEVEFNRGVTWIEAVPIDQGSAQIDN